VNRKAQALEEAALLAPGHGQGRVNEIASPGYRWRLNDKGLINAVSIEASDA
jgi:hypothetical protein